MDELSPTGGGEEYGAWGDAVDVGDDGKIADIGLLCHTGETSVGKSADPADDLFFGSGLPPCAQDCCSFWAFQVIQKDSSQYFS